jgi:hypothetical protein
MSEKLGLPLATVGSGREIARTEEDLQPATKAGDVSAIGYAAILATYSVSSSTAFMPFIFGILGYVAAPVMLALYFLLCGSLQQKVLEIARLNPQVHNMPSLAELVAGRWGRFSYQFLQIANQQLFLPCALLFVIKSLKQIVLPASADGYVHPKSITGFLSCNVNWIYIVIGIAFVCTNLQRRFGHASNLCKVTCVANLLQVALIVARAYINDDDPQRKVTPAYALPAFELSDTVGDRANWADVFTALSSFGYCYVPVFIATEAMQEMKIKSHAVGGLWVSTVGMLGLYAVVGICPVLAWGWRREFEVLSELQGDMFGRLANVMLFLASGMDFLITAISLNQRLQENIDPGFDARDWSWKSNVKWLLLSMPSLIITFLMLCFIPDLNSLVGLMTAFVVPFSQIIGPALLTLLASRKGLLGTQLRLKDWFLIIVGVCIGTVMLIVGGASTIKSIFFNGPLIKGNFFCDAVAG